jgi:hypothetical protein
MKAAVLLLTLFLLGCDTVPVERNFPAVPPALLAECPALLQTPQGAKFSEVLTIVNSNYAEYHQCRAKTQAWIQWYTEQKKIFEEVK